VTHAKPAAHCSSVISDSDEPPAKKPHIDSDEHNKTVKKVCFLYDCRMMEIFVIN